MNPGACYECKNHNHQDCVIRKNRKKRNGKKHTCKCFKNYCSHITYPGES